MAAPSEARTAAGSASARDVVRWGAFCCLLVPVVLLLCGAPLATAAMACAWLSALTAVCWGLFAAARSAAGGVRTPAHRRPLFAPGAGAHRAGRRTRR